MRALRFLFVLTSLILTLSVSARPQDAARLERLLGVSGRQKPAPLLPLPQGLQDHVSNGKLVLSLDDSIRLALSNNTDIRIDRSQIEFAQNNLRRVHAPFDPWSLPTFPTTKAKHRPSRKLRERRFPTR